MSSSARALTRTALVLACVASLLGCGLGSAPPSLSLPNGMANVRDSGTSTSAEHKGNGSSEQPPPRDAPSCLAERTLTLVLGQYVPGPSACRFRYYEVEDSSIVKVDVSPDHCPFDMVGRRVGKTVLRLWHTSANGPSDDEWCLEVVASAPSSDGGA